MASGWWIIPGAVFGAVTLSVSAWHLGLESSLWVAAALAVLTVLWLFGFKVATSFAMAAIMALLLRRERKAGYADRDAQHSRNALDAIRRGSRARDGVDLSDDRLRDDDGHRRD